MSTALPSELTKKDLENEAQSQLRNSGISFYITYIGSLIVNHSMNEIQDIRLQQTIGCDCIRIALHAAKRLSVLELVNPEIFDDDEVDLYNCEVQMNITTKSIMIIADGMKILQKFLIHDISLAVPGSGNVTRFFCLFAHAKEKDTGEMTRRCFVFYAEAECRLIMKTVGSAFLLYREDQGSPTPEPCEQEQERQERQEQQRQQPIPKARNYSRDKTPTPPTISATPSTSTLDQRTFNANNDPTSQLRVTLSETHITDPKRRNREASRSSSKSPLSSASSSKSIIYESPEDMLTPRIIIEKATPKKSHGAPPIPPPRSRNNSAILPSPQSEFPRRNEPERQSIPRGGISRQGGRRNRAADFPNMPGRDRSQSMAVNITSQQFAEITKNLNHEPWFHGKLSRAAAESYIVQNGQFLVRQSPNIRGQIVLSGMQLAIVKHICLVDHEGCLRTTEGEFGTVSQLIKYYYQNRRPVTSDSSELILIEPVYRRGIRFKKWPDSP